MKETFYFPHDYNSSQDPKIMALLSTCGLDGVGMYWILIEILHQQPDSKILYKSYLDFIEFYGRINEENEQLLSKIKQMLINVGLIIKDGDFVYSTRVLLNKKERENISKIRSIAGKKGAKIRINKAIAKQSLANAKQGKEMKGKENNILQSEIAEFVSDKYIEQLIQDKQKHISLIGKYLKERKCEFPTKLAAQLEIKRWLKPARELVEYNENQINQSFSYVSRVFSKEWNLNTVAKYANNPAIWT